MKRRRTLRTVMCTVLSLVLMLQIVTMDALAKPPGGGSSSGGSSSISWSGATEITSATTSSNQTYASTTASQNAVLINTSGAVTLASPTVTKSGGTSAGDDESFYGINSAVMCKGGGTTTITDANITTNAGGANGVFSYGGNATTNATSGDGTTVVISDSTIETTGDGSGGIMTTGQGTTQASNLTITTSGNSSAAIRSDRGGGTVTVDGGTYQTSGTGSPAVYATATITVSNATLTSTASQGVVNEGGNTVNLNNCTVNAGNSTLGSQDKFKNGVFLYQSMSGDATDGASVFTMTGGTLNNTYGHVFHVTNTSAAITLNGVTVNNTDSEGVFLSVCDDAWSGLSNVATVNATDQTISGTMLVGSDSTLKLNLSGSSTWTGTTSGAITSHRDSSTVSSSLGTVNVTLADTASVVLSADTTLSSITGTGTINYNGHTLTVGSTSYTSGSPGVSTITEADTSSTTKSDQSISYATKSISKTTSDSSFTNPLTETTVDGTISYSSSDTSVATVNSSTGEVSIAGAGTTTITATAAATDSYYAATASYTLTVTAASTTDDSDDETSPATLSFSESAITETVSGSGYNIDGTVLEITEAGEYRITGSCSDGSIQVKKSLSDVTLVLDGLTLATTTTGNAPIVVGKGSAVDLVFLNTSTLTDSESDPSSDDYEGAAIKVKLGASLTLKGASSGGTDSSGEAYSAGVLNLVGTAKNGIKGAATATVTMYSGTVNITAANHGLAADGSVVVSGGTLNITAGNDGIKSEPDEDDTESNGTVTITGGTIKIDTQSKSGGDGIQATNGITISGGTFDIDSYNDGIQSNADLTISGGTFDIVSYGGYTNGSAVEQADISAKGLKASASDEDTDNATNALTISGGTFTLNCADDAIHSDGTITVTGGTFTIDTGDDGMHADTTLTVGTSGGLTRDPYITVNNSYEGLEAGTVNLLGGKIYVVASDDGVNAAGGSSNGTAGSRDATGTNRDHFNPGGAGSTDTGSYAINISGGKLYVNADGDGLDSNGSLTLSGGEVEVWGASASDNGPLDYEGTLTIGSGATVFAAGSTSGMGYQALARDYASYIKTASISKDSTVTVTNGGTTAYQSTAPKSASFLLYNGATGFSVSISGSLSCEYAHACSSAHSWSSSVSGSTVTYACSHCGATETQTAAPTWTDTTYMYTGSGSGTTADAGFTVTFTTGANCAVTVYQTQDTSGTVTAMIPANGSGTDVSRDGDTGAADSSGDGESNFVVTVDSGYQLTGVTATSGTYQSIEAISSDTTANTYTYRVYKISADTTVAVTAQLSDSSSSGGSSSGSGSSGGGGSSGSSSGASTSDSGTTTSETRDDGTEVLTTTYQDGRKIVTETKPDGSTGKVEWNADDTLAAAEATISQEALTAAQKEGKPVLLPVTIPTAATTAVAASLRLTLPEFLKSAGAMVPELLEVEIPVTNGGPATVAYLKNADRSLTLIKECRTGSIIVPVTGSCELVVADNTRFFPDVENHWARDSIKYTTAREIFNGTDKGFEPEATMTRAMVAQVVYNYDRYYEAGIASAFSDVKEGAWYANAIGWASAQGYVKGYGESYGVNDSITRQDLVTILYRYAKDCGYKTSESEALGAFTDAESVSGYAQEAMRWAIGNGIINGFENDTLLPEENATRAQVAAIMQRFVNMPR